MEQAVSLTAGHCIKMTFCGPTNTKGARWRLTWEGWPSTGRATVSRYLSYDYASNRDGQMQEAARMFCAWLGDMPGDDRKRVYIPKSVTYGSLSPDAWVLLVNATTEA